MQIPPMIPKLTDTMRDTWRGGGRYDGPVQSRSRWVVCAAIVISCLTTRIVSAQDALRPDTQRDGISARRDVPVLTAIQPGDLLDVQVFDTPELGASKVRVNQDGKIELPVVGAVSVAGLTSLEASQTIAAKLSDMRIMLSPAVTVFIAEYATAGVKVLGEVRTPGIYLLLGSHSLYDALAAAGGATHEQGATISVANAKASGPPLIVHVDQANYQDQQRITQLQSGDVVVVSRAAVFYVIGDVGRPGEYQIQNRRPVSVLNAVALAQGLNPTAAVSKASIIRPTTDGGALKIRIDLKLVQQNKASNVILQPNDVLVVPRSGLKQFLTYAIPNATSAVVGSVAAALVVR